MRIQRIAGGWRVWTGTRDYRVGSYIQLMNDGSAYKTTARIDEGDETIQVRPTDKEVEPLQMKYPMFTNRELAALSLLVHSAIMSTPTGEARNQLTDINIKLMHMKDINDAEDTRNT